MRRLAHTFNTICICISIYCHLIPKHDFRSLCTQLIFEAFTGFWPSLYTTSKHYVCVLHQCPLYCQLISAVSVDDVFIDYSSFLQAKLQEFLGRKDLDRHLDADEAIVLGAALHAANLSDGIKLNRKLGMVDGSSYGLVVELDGPDLLKDESTRQLIVPRMKKLSSKVLNQLY